MSRSALRLRWLTPGSSIGFCAVALGVVWMLASARSPLAIPMADAIAGSGRTSMAVDRYDAIAEVGISEWMRHDALWKAGNLLEIDLRNTNAARQRFRALSVIEEAPHRADALERVGRILEHNDRRPDAAAIAFLDAWRAEPSHERAPERVRRAALAFQEAGDVDAALEAWETLELDYPSLRGRAQLGRAALFLIQDDEAAALASYRDALEGDDASLHAVARLGSATCLERLGNLDEALAELDASDLPDDVRDARAGTIRARLVYDE